MLLTSKANLRVCQLDVRQVPPPSKAKGLMFLFATQRSKPKQAMPWSTLTKCVSSRITHSAFSDASQVASLADRASAAEEPSDRQPVGTARFQYATGSPRWKMTTSA